jgi:glycosyltransferase involved in cell wall biosynthesis
MKILYIATSVIPAGKANSYQVMKMCEAFTRLNIETELIIPVRFGGVVEKADPFEYYGIKKKFKIRKIFSLDLIPYKKYIGRLGFWIQNISFAFLALIYLFFKKTDIIYSRDRFTLLFLCLFKKNLVYEIHSLPPKFRFYERFLYRKVRFVVAITNQMKKILIKESIVREDKVLVAPDAVDLEIFNSVHKSKEELRDELILPKDKKLVSYVGSLYTKGKEKGISNMLRALKILREDEKNLVMMFVGGNEQEIKGYQREAEQMQLKNENLIFIKRVPFTEVSKYEKASDILIIPFPQQKHYAYYASPLKLFEYMASGEPIVTSDLPSIREILNENNSILIKPDNPEAMAIGIKKALNDIMLSESIAKQAYQDVQKYTWDNRAKKILEFICVG